MGAALAKWCGLVEPRQRLRRLRLRPRPSGDAAQGTDDGTKLTLWTRAPLEKQAKLLVAAYNASHKNQVALTVVPNDDYVAKVGAAAGAKGLPDLFAADIVYVPNWVKQGLFQDLTGADQRPALQGLDQPGSPDGRDLPDGKEYVLPFVLDLSMLFWNKDLFKEAGLDPDTAPATMAEYAKDAKAIQALNKPGVYGTATGLNCGGCLVFTWFPSVWAVGDQVMNPEGTEVAARQRHGQERLQHVAGPVEGRRGAAVVQGRGRPDLDRRVHRRARSA